VNPDEIACPECGVPPGRPCLTTAGRRKSPHRKRRRKHAPKGELVIIPDPTAVRCPSWSCQARPGLPCVTTDGRTVHPHRPRWVAAIIRTRDMAADGPQPDADAMNPPSPADDNSPAPQRP
jgi:hypothetical protein